MVYEWDEAKSRANLERHGLAFEDAEAVFEGDVITVVDQRKDYGDLVLLRLERCAGAWCSSPTQRVPGRCASFQ
jgi:hypothetical protein